MLNPVQFWLEKKLCQGEKSIIQFSCMSSRNHNQRFIDYSPGRARKRAEDGSTGLKELADEVNGEGGYVLDDNVSFQSTELFSDCPELSALSRLCGPDTRLTQVEEETASNSHLDGLAGLNLTSL